MSEDELKAFWASHRPDELKLLGDRLLAECLPRYPDRSPQFYSPDLAQRREALGLSMEAVAKRLGVSQELLAAWERGDIRPPASLVLLYPLLGA